jgi:hypothetical protein
MAELGLQVTLKAVKFIMQVAGAALYAILMEL